MTVCEQCGQIEMMAITQPCFECRELNKSAEDHDDDLYIEDDEDYCWDCDEKLCDCQC